MRWHSYQSLVARARRKRISSTGGLPVGRSGVSPEHIVANSRQAGSPPGTQARRLRYARTESFDYDYDYDYEQEQEQE